jgi:hypothetical protein
MAPSPNDDAIPELDDERTSHDVGREGGSPGDVEFDRGDDSGTGSEASETWRPTERDKTEVHRDETGIGRRSPEGGARP